MNFDKGTDMSKSPFVLSIILMAGAAVLYLIGTFVGRYILAGSEFELKPVRRRISS